MATKHWQSYTNRASGVFILIYLFICVNCKMAVRIQLKIGRYNIQVRESNLSYVPVLHTPLFKCSN